MKYHLVCAVWGERFTDLFLNICLPNQLTPGNIPALAKGETAEYKIYTSSIDASVIMRSQNFRKVQEILPTKVIALDHLFKSGRAPGDKSLLIMSQCHKAAVASANLEDAALIFLPPDQVYSEGAFARLRKIAESGKRAIMTLGPRLVKETFAPAFKETFCQPDETLLASPRDLVKLALNHLHPITKSLFVDSNNFNNSPTQFYWRAQGGILARCLHLHPLMIYPSNNCELLYGNCDTDFLLSACPRRTDYYIVTDSDEIAAFEMSPLEKSYGMTDNNLFSASKSAAFIKRAGNRIHHRFLREPIYLHAGDLTDDWAQAEQAAGKVIRKTAWLRHLQ